MKPTKLASLSDKLIYAAGKGQMPLRGFNQAAVIKNSEQVLRWPLMKNLPAYLGRCRVQLITG